MKALPTARVEHLTDPHHETLRNLYFDKERGQLIAADGFGMVAIPVEADSDDVSGPIPIEAIEFARSHHGHLTLSKNSVQVTTSRGQMKWNRPKNYPERLEEIIQKSQRETNIHAISLDANRLLQITKALLGRPSFGAYGVTLEIRGPADPIVLRPYDFQDDERFALIMPMFPKDAK